MSHSSSRACDAGMADEEEVDRDGLRISVEDAVGCSFFVGLATNAGALCLGC